MFVPYSHCCTDVLAKTTPNRTVLTLVRKQGLTGWEGGGGSGGEALEKKGTPDVYVRVDLVSYYPPVWVSPMFQ